MKTTRPFIITLVSLVWMLVLFATVGMLIYSEHIRVVFASNYPSPFNLLFLGALGISFVGIAGFWLMRRWGVYLYTLATVIFLVVSFAIGFQFTTSFLPLLILVLSCVYVRKMA